MPTSLLPAKQIESQSSAAVQDVEQKEVLPKKSTSYFVSSLITGVISTGVFNPIDRGLYLAVTEKRPFLSRKNFISPYQGAWQAMVQKCTVGNTYYIVQNELEAQLRPYMLTHMKANELAINISTGLISGTVNAIINNPANTIKYQTWNGDKQKYFKTVHSLWLANGLKSFSRGTNPTIYRDAVFGVVYEVSRQYLHSQIDSVTKIQAPQNSLISWGFACNALSGMFATLIASPFNYARNMQLKVQPSEKAPSTYESLNALYKEAKLKNSSYLERAGFFANKCQLGWGTARSGVGMAVGQTVFRKSRKLVDEYLSEPLSKSNKL